MCRVGAGITGLDIRVRAHEIIVSCLRNDEKSFSYSCLELTFVSYQIPMAIRHSMQ